MTWNLKMKIFHTELLSEGTTVIFVITPFWEKGGVGLVLAASPSARRICVNTNFTH